MSAFALGANFWSERCPAVPPCAACPDCSCKSRKCPPFPECPDVGAHLSAFKAECWGLVANQTERCDRREATAQIHFFAFGVLAGFLLCLLISYGCQRRARRSGADHGPHAVATYEDAGDFEPSVLYRQPDRPMLLDRSAIVARARRARPPGRDAVPLALA